MMMGVWWLSGLITALYCLADVKHLREISWGDLGLAALLGMAGPLLTMIVLAPRCLYDHTFWNKPICKRKGRR